MTVARAAGNASDDLKERQAQLDLRREIGRERLR